MRPDRKVNRFILLLLLLLFLAPVPGASAAEGVPKEEQRATPKAPPPSGQGTVILKPGAEYALGRDDAPVTIVEYTDYQCPYCSRFQMDTFPEIKKNFIDTGKVRFIKRDLPLAFHPNALPAAQAARCAGDQGKFWEMHKRLFAKPTALGPETYYRYARELSLDAGLFQTCLSSRKHVAGIREDARTASAAGIRVAPSFILGIAKGDTLSGVKITGAAPYAVFERTIRDLLASPADKAPAP